MKSLIWDLDGTLVDSYEIITKNIYKTLKPYKIMLKKDILKIIKDSSVSHLFITFAEENQVPINELVTHYHALSDEVSFISYNLIPGVKDVLEATALKGYKHYVYTHRGLSTNKILKVNNIDHYFEEVVTSDNKFSRKPSPEALNYLIQKYNLNRNETYYIGDRSLDIECGKNANLKTVFFNEDGKVHHEATLSIQSFSHLENQL